MTRLYAGARIRGQRKRQNGGIRDNPRLLQPLLAYFDLAEFDKEV